MAKNLDIFLNHPWGTTSFLMTLKSVTARGADKLQLLFLQSVSRIRELQFSEVDEDDDSEMEETHTKIKRLWSLYLDIVGKVDRQYQVSSPSPMWIITYIMMVFLLKIA